MSRTRPCGFAFIAMIVASPNSLSPSRFHAKDALRNEHGDALLSLTISENTPRDLATFTDCDDVVSSLPRLIASRIP